MNPFKDFKQLLEKYLHEETIPFIEGAWNEPHRKYHNINHLETIINELIKNKNIVHPSVFDALILAAFFHDVYYNPKSGKNNEDESIKRFLNSYKYSDLDLRNLIVAMIESTKHRKIPTNNYVRIFWEADNAGFYKNYDYFLNNEKQIREEFIHVPKSLYKKARLEFLKSNLGLFNSKVDENLNKLIKYVSDKY